MKRTLPTLILILISTSFYLNAQNIQLPYYNNFENGLDGWTCSDNSNGTSWQLGVPTTGYTYGAYSGTHCWDVNLNSTYTNSSVCHLISPVFDFSLTANTKISFFTHYRTEFLWDYLTVQYSVDNGDTWVFLPFPNLNNPDGMTPKWLESSLVTSDLYSYSNVQFRFTFISDGSTIYDGYSIDDFRIETDPLSTPSELNQESAFAVYPNPSVGELNFIFPDPVQKDAFVQIYDSKGNVVLRQNVQTISNKQDLHLAKGIYSVVYSNEHTLVQKKLVVLE